MFGGKQKRKTIRGLISMLKKAEKRYGNIKVVDVFGRSLCLKGWYRSGATWRFREYDEPIVLGSRK